MDSENVGNYYYNKGITLSEKDMPQIITNSSPVDDDDQKNAQNSDELHLQQHEHEAKKLVPSKAIELFVSECIGTGLLLFLGCMGCVMQVHAGISIPPHFIGLSFGLSVMIIVQCFGHISGAHLNPAVTIASVFLGHMKPVIAPIYFAAQFIGAVLGFGLLKSILPSEYTATEVFNEATNTTTIIPGLCSTLPNPSISMLQATCIETITTAVLILICCAIWDKRNSANMDSLALRFGLAIAALAMVSGGFTGCSMNTARSFAPALLNGDWHGHWVYWVAPTAGATIASFFYKSMFAIEDEIDFEDEVQMEQCIAKNNEETKP